jgi:hypothetical protein
METEMQHVHAVLVIQNARDVKVAGWLLATASTENFLGASGFLAAAAKPRGHCLLDPMARSRNPHQLDEADTTGR